jgi:hypothetical protein
MRFVLALLAATLTATALHAAKPVPAPEPPRSGVEAAREQWRGLGVSQCVANLRAVRALGPDDLESICGCAIDGYLEGIGNAAPVPVTPGPFPAPVRSQLISCTGRIQPEQMGAVARVAMAVPPTAAPDPRQAPPAMEMPPGGDKPTGETEGMLTDAADSESGGGFWSWLETIALPAWLTGASILWWIAIGIFVFGMLILRIRGRDPRKDLTGPPSHFRRGAPPQPPRRPDLPR